MHSSVIYLLLPVSLMLIKQQKTEKINHCSLVNNLSGFNMG